MIRKYNKQHIIYYQINEEKESDSFFFMQEQKSLFGKVLREEGFYDYKDNKLKKLPDGFYFKHGKVYQKLNLEIVYTEGYIERIYFNNYVELKKYIKAEFQGKEWN